MKEGFTGLKSAEASSRGVGAGDEGLGVSGFRDFGFRGLGMISAAFGKFQDSGHRRRACYRGGGGSESYSNSVLLSCTSTYTYRILCPQNPNQVHEEGASP